MMALTKEVPSSIIGPNSFCPGCGHGIATRLIAEVLDEMELATQAIGVLAVGCSCLANRNLGVDLLQCAHGRAAAAATGIKRVRGHNTVFTYQGDGDAASIGIAETIYAAAEKELAALCAELGMAVMGVNCAGFINNIDEIFAFGMIVEGGARRGNIALLSQSGKICLNAMQVDYLKYSYLVSSGNGTAISTEDYLDYLIEDEDTKVIGLYLEGRTKARPRPTPLSRSFVSSA